MELLIVTGMSGAGKTLAVRALEDIGFYCVDNMPPMLMGKFAELCDRSARPLHRVALVTDVRSGAMFDTLSEALQALKSQGQDYRVLYLDCADEALCRRYKETRRRHPLAQDTEPVEQALRRERQLLQPLFDRADYRLDTTRLTTAQLKQQITALFLEEAEGAMTVQCISFGFKYGFPAEADVMLDVRCFPNPFYEPSLKPLTGLDEPVREFVLAAEDTKEFLRRLYGMLDHLLPLYVKEGKSQLVIAIGCTGGKHRSVAITEALATHIRMQNHRVTVNHRDIDK